MSVQSIFSLPQQLQDEFGELQTLYMQRKFADCVPIIDKMLEQYPDCVDVLSLKGLVFSNIPERHHEALPAIKKAVKINIKSDVAWQALGGYHSGEGNYEQALKSYNQAIAVAKKPSPTILKDLSRVQLYLRKDYGFLQSRQEMFIRDRNSRLDWMAIPVAADICGRYSEAATILESWFKLPQGLRSRCTPQWSSQIRIYLAELLEKAGKYDQAAAHMAAAIELDPEFRDVVKANIILGRISLRVGDWEQARESYRSLLQYLPNNMDYMIGLMISYPEYHFLLDLPFDVSDVDANKATDQERRVPERLYPDIITNAGVRSTMYATEPLASLPGLSSFEKLMDPLTGERKVAYNRGDLWRLFWAGVVPPKTLSSDEVETAKSFVHMFQDLAKKFSNSEILTLFPLAFLPATSEFMPIIKETLTNLFLRKLRKGAISLVVQCSMLAVSEVPGRSELVLQCLEDAMAEVRNTCENAKQSSGVQEAVYLATKSVIVRRVLKDYPTSWQLLEQAVEILPTLIDLYTLKAEYLLEEDRGAEACDLYIKCSEMNMADKQLRSDACEALFKCGRIQEGIELMENYNKTSPDKTSSKFDTQDVALELAFCRGLVEIGMHEEAASRLAWSIRRLELNQEDVQDFFTYSLRIGNVSALTDYIRYLRRIYTLASAQEALAMLCGIIFARLDKKKSARPTNCTDSSDRDELLKAIKDFPCEIPEKEVVRIDKLSDELLLTNVLVPILSKFRSDVDIQSFTVLRLSYQVHSRASTRKPWVMAFCLSQAFKLANRNIYHPELIRLLLHYLTVQHEDQDVLARLLDPAMTNLTAEEYVKQIEQRLGQSSDVRDRLSLIRAYEDCLAAETREQGKCDLITNTMVDKLRESFAADKEQLLKVDARSFYGAVRQLGNSCSF